MNGLLAAGRYYNFFGRPMIEKKFPGYLNRLAAGLAGEGSECFGFDDRISTDHDWGPGFCIWLNEMDFEDIGNDLQEEYNNLPCEFAGITYRKRTESGIKRTGVFEINSFYEKFTGLNSPPSNWNEWINIKETNLASCTNGKIFHDSLGEFSGYRKKLLEFYPEEVRLKKIADRCFVISREGQYNFIRCAARGESVAASLAEAKFIEASVSLAFLINWSYTPYYKWMHRALYYLPVLGVKLHELLHKLSSVYFCGNAEEMFNSKAELIETICGYIIEELNRQQISSIKSPFLMDHCPAIINLIDNPELRDFPPVEI